MATGFFLEKKVSSTIVLVRGGCVHLQCSLETGSQTLFVVVSFEYLAKNQYNITFTKKNSPSGLKTKWGAILLLCIW